MVAAVIILFAMRIGYAGWSSGFRFAIGWARTAYLIANQNNRTHSPRHAQHQRNIPTP